MFRNTFFLYIFQFIMWFFMRFAQWNYFSFKRKAVRNYYFKKKCSKIIKCFYAIFLYTFGHKKKPNDLRQHNWLPSFTIRLLASSCQKMKKCDRFFSSFLCFPDILLVTGYNLSKRHLWINRIHTITSWYYKLNVYLKISTYLLHCDYNIHPALAIVNNLNVKFLCILYKSKYKLR